MRLLPCCLIVACTRDQPTDSAENPGDPPLAEDVLSVLSPERMQAHVNFLADDDLGGRMPGSVGHQQAIDYIHGELQDMGLQPLGLDDSFLHTYETSPSSDSFMLDESGAVVPQAVEQGVNLVGVVPGTDPQLADEYILVMAHYDHLGVDEDGAIFNGAFDDASGVAMGLELARLFAEGCATTRRSLIFLFVDEEEFGLDGSEAWLDNPTVPLTDVVAGISVDPVGRGVLPDFWPVVLMGTERSPEFAAVWREAEKWADPETPVVFINRDIIPVFASDQDNLYDLSDPIPGVWFVNPGMSFYHTPEDTPETIDYRVLRHTTRFLATALKLIGDDENRYAYEGSPELNAQMAGDALELFNGVEASSEITGSERIRNDSYREVLEAVVAADDISVIESPDAFFLGAAYFVLFELTSAHPGEIPPPFPD